jgi:quercetin dioxygenase-like cupin family protein
MLKNTRIRIFMIAAIAFLFPSFLLAKQESPQKPVPRIIRLDAQGKEYLRILGGPPETVTMRSGLVTLAPKKSVGKHNTEDYEELVIILDGQAEMQITGGEKLELAKGFAAYVPPHTEHDVLNTGSDTLRYIYVVAEAKS